MSSRGPIVFFGTPAFAVPTLDAMADGGFGPDLVVTQPSRPVGRGRRVRLPPVGAWATERGVELAQIDRVKRTVFLDALAERRPWVAVVVAFGQIFPRRLLEIPQLGCVNLHGSLLPRHRGAAPVQAALKAGDRLTGVCTMRMERGLDTGPVYACREVEIGPTENAAELAERLSVLGGPLVVETLSALAAGTAVATPQDESLATYAPRIDKKDGRVDWRSSGVDLANLYRAYTPWPGLTAALDGEPVKLLDVAAAEVASAQAATGGPGVFHGLSEAGLVIECGEGSKVSVGRLQRPGRRALAAAEFVNGERLEPGARFGRVEDEPAGTPG